MTSVPPILPFALLALVALTTQCWQNNEAAQQNAELQQTEGQQPNAGQQPNGGAATPSAAGPRTGAPDAPAEGSALDPEQARAERAREARQAEATAETSSNRDLPATGLPTKELGAAPEGQRPRGTDPADIRAMRGAEAMLEVERKLERVLGQLKVEGKSEFLPFDVLDNWPYEDGFIGMPERIKVWDKKRVAMAGFMLPIDSVENIKEFYLVKSLWSCCYGVPPDVNGLIKIRLRTERGIDFHYDPLLLVGEFRLEKEMDEDYCVAIYQLDAELAQAIDVTKLR